MQLLWIRRHNPLNAVNKPRDNKSQEEVHTKLTSYLSKHEPNVCLHLSHEMDMSEDERV